jgi:hypothetical protein
MKVQENSIKIKYKGVNVICHNNGSITKFNMKSGKPIRTFGTIKDGYLITAINGQNEPLHRIIYTAFHGKIPNGKQVDHINGDKGNNNPKNLRSLTPKENCRGYKRAHGKYKYRGVSKGMSKGTFRWQINTQDGYTSKAGYPTARDAALGWDREALRQGYLKEALNFPELMVDLIDKNEDSSTMNNREENMERIQTQIEMIRSESRLLSYRIDRMVEQRKKLSDEKRQLKLLLEMG